MAAFDGDPESETVEYEPVGVKDLLVAMKNSSELIVDLAYSALLHNSEQLAKEVLELESQMDRLQIQARMNLLIAVRNPKDAKQLAPVLGVVGATEKISNAAGDIAAVVLEEEQFPVSIRAALPEAMEMLVRAPLSPASPFADRSLGELDLETETGVRVIGIRTDDEWELDPNNETATNSLHGRCNRSKSKSTHFRRVWRPGCCRRLERWTTRSRFEGYFGSQTAQRSSVMPPSRSPKGSSAILRHIP